MVSCPYLTVRAVLDCFCNAYYLSWEKIRSFKTTKSSSNKSSKRVLNNIFQVFKYMLKTESKSSPLIFDEIFKTINRNYPNGFLKTVLNDRKEFLKVQVFRFFLKDKCFEWWFRWQWKSMPNISYLPVFPKEVKVKRLESENETFYF